MQRSFEKCLKDKCTFSNNFCLLLTGSYGIVNHESQPQSATRKDTGKLCLKRKLEGSVCEDMEAKNESCFIDDSNIGSKRRCLRADGFDKKNEDSTRHKTCSVLQAIRKFSNVKRTSRLGDLNPATDSKTFPSSCQPKKNNQMIGIPENACGNEYDTEANDKGPMHGTEELHRGGSCNPQLNVEMNEERPVDDTSIMPGKSSMKTGLLLNQQNQPAYTRSSCGKVLEKTGERMPINCFNYTNGVLIEDSTTAKGRRKAINRLIALRKRCLSIKNSARRSKEESGRCSKGKLEVYKSNQRNAHFKQQHITNGRKSNRSWACW